MLTGLARPLPNQCSPQNDIISCGMPTRQDIENAAEIGFKTVISLCSPSDTPAYEPAQARALGMSFYNISVCGPADLTRDKAMALAEIVNDCSKHPILLHCMSGNRVGALMALKAFHADGATPDQALKFGLAAGLTMLAPEVERLLRHAKRAE
ncbi:MAG: hypothetical protein IPM37_17095 [Hahellaceae bacterium]|nr:hypothetical protein [Hahellaceae bacterium]